MGITSHNHQKIFKHIFHAKMSCDIAAIGKKTPLQVPATTSASFGINKTMIK